MCTHHKGDERKIMGERTNKKKHEKDTNKPKK